nr:MAG TPA: hypothetical protein [Caudoviricetes sp.]
MPCWWVVKPDFIFHLIYRTYFNSKPPLFGPKSGMKKCEGSKNYAVSECWLTGLTGF